MTRALAWLLACVTAVSAVLPGTLAAGAETADGPPKDCGRAHLAGPEKGADGSVPRLSAHADGRYTPILLVHGWTGNPDSWQEPIAFSTLPDKPKVNHSLLGNLQGLTGAAVYTLDYQDVAQKWFTEQGAGGEKFLEAEACLTRQAAFQGHKMIILAHSMGGLITRWSLADAAGAEARRSRIGLIVTLGTPYRGSDTAALGTFLADTAINVGAKVDKRFAALAELIHLLIAQCHGVDLPGCRELNYLVDWFATVHAFAPDSPQLTSLGDWPQGTRVHTLATQTILDDISGLFLAPTSVKADFGDVIVSVSSATAGQHPNKVGGCQLTMSALRSVTNELLIAAKLQARIDTPTHVLLGLLADCFHGNQMRLIQLTNEVLGLIADELGAAEPSYSYLGASEIGIVRGDRIAAKAAGKFTGGVAYTADGRLTFATSGQPATTEIVAIDAITLTERRLACQCKTRAVASGGSSVAWLGKDDRLHAADLSQAQPQPAAARAVLPPKPADYGSDGWTNIHPGPSGKVVISYTNGASAYGGPEDLWLVDPSGAQPPRSLGTTESNLPASQLAPSAAGPKIAYVVGGRGGYCSTFHWARIWDQTQNTTVTAESALVAAQRENGGLDVSDLWWGRDGQLYATISTWACAFARADAEVPLVPSSLWRLDGTRWTLADAGPLVAVRQLTANTKAVLIPATTSQTGGALYTETDGKGTKIADGVWDIAMPPNAATDKSITAQGNTSLTAPCEAGQFDQPVDMLFCNGRYAFVRFKGGGVGGRGQSELHIGHGGKWKVLVGGSTSQGELSNCDIASVGLDPDFIMKLLPQGRYSVFSGC